MATGFSDVPLGFQRTSSWKEAQSSMERVPFVPPTLKEEASLAEVTLVSEGSGGGSPT